ncbi:MAG TPA: alanine racemase [Candidatus Merdisoma merdipullorum]|nr:alanine racemase [Candidatus Merdisoma merdipullorum]
MEGYRRAAAFVDLDAIEANFEAIRKTLKEGTQIAAVIKTNGYGHGAAQIARLAEQKEYIWGFAVATVEEALELRKSGIEKPVLVLGYVFPENYGELVEQHIRPAVFRLDMAEKLSGEAVRRNRKLPVHIKVDTGMSRIGFADTAESADMVCRIGNLPGLELEGLFTHFARADEADKTFAGNQFTRFLKFREACAERGVRFPLCHCANSAAIIDMPETQMNLVRAGIAIYGLYPSEEVVKEQLSLRPAMELKSHIVHVKEIPAGTQVSYGGIYTAKETRRIATIPVGYGDGYPRSLSDKGCVLIAGKRAPIRGRVCMDQFMADVTEIPEAEPGMEVTLFGRDAKEALPVEELSAISGRFNYELVCDISPRVPRIYLRKGRAVEISEGDKRVHPVTMS